MTTCLQWDVQLHAAIKQNILFSLANCAKYVLNTLDHFLMTYILAGKANSGQCEGLITYFDAMCNELGVPLAHEKFVGPSAVLIFL